MTDRDHLLAEINAGRAVTLMALADWEEEHGDAGLAAGLRWLAGYDRWPLYVARRVLSPDAPRGPGGVLIAPETNATYDQNWEWWRAKPDAVFSCSLPTHLMDEIRRAAATPKGQTCTFGSAGEAVLAAAAAAGKLIALELLE